MKKLEKLQKEYPMFKLTIVPATEATKKHYVDLGCDEPKNILVFHYGEYSENVCPFEWRISVLRKSLNRWVNKI